ncbi:MAG: phosphate acyltransferase PlsX [Gemmatimonadaceae bacterium]|nr:phosphate acyltransferase PlsX [Gemmatimonadaceae bacterium]
MARIALDAMGGDFAPSAPVAGALLALAELDPSHRLQLVGIPSVIRRALDEALSGAHAGMAPHADRLDIIEASDIIEMGEKPSAVIRGKPNSSMHVGLKLQVDGESEAFVSAGNTGAQMAISTLILRLHPGLSRPAISTVFPTAAQSVVVLDSGANVDCSPQELVQFARLGAVYAEDMLGRTNPSIGLLSIGEEPEKGNVAVKEAHQLLLRSGLNFHGNVEGRDIPLGRSDRGAIDVVVCDGFVGNALLKFYEAIAPTLINMVARSAGLSKEQLAATFKHLDYSEHGGAPLLGVKGVSIISHGKSNPRAITSAIKVALRAVETRMNDHIGRRLTENEQAGSAA